MKPLSLDSVGPAKQLLTGTERSVEPHETLERIAPLLSHVGITRIANVTGMDTVGIPTVVATRPNARSLSVSQGKGCDLTAAKVSAVMESIEQWHAERIDRPLWLATYSEVARTRAVADVHRLPRYLEAYEDQRILWIEGAELRSGTPQLVPYEMIHLDLTIPFPTGSGHFVTTSNGLASGNCAAEAIEHALCELIERDASSLFYRMSAEQQWSRRVDLETVGSATCRHLLAAFERAELDVAVWETTSDVGVPSFLCSVLDRERNPFRPMGVARGSGCHPAPAIALSRALTEAAQSRLTRITGARDDIAQGDFDRLQSEAKFEQARRQMHAPVRPPRELDEASYRARATFEEDIAAICEQLASAGMPDVIAVDLSRPEFPISVVRVVVPGLEAPCEAPGYQPGARALAIDEELA